MAVKYYISASKNCKKKRVYLSRRDKPTVWRILAKRGYFLIGEFPMLRKWEQRTGATLKIEGESGKPDYPNATHYSENFKKSELDCKCGCKTPADIQKNLVRVCDTMLEPLRLRIGTVVVLSGYRCPSYNAKIGGAKSSQHMQGKAIDFNRPAMGISQEDLVAEIKRIDAVNGIGVYPNGGVHGDLRRPPRVVWSSF